jgi:RNA polymerase sigma-70 factor (ECF subfamily)
MTPPPPAMSEDMLLAQLRAGDTTAYRTLVRDNHAGLVRLARSFCRNLATAEEVVQDSWLAVVRGLDGFTGASQLKTWIASIVVNKARTRAVRDARMRSFADMQGSFDGEGGPGFDLDRFAQSGAWIDPPLPWQGVTPERVVAGRQLMAHVADHLDRLPANQRAAVLLRDVQGLDPREVCAALEITEGHLRVLLHRARTRLRAALEAMSCIPDGWPTSPPAVSCGTPPSRGCERSIRRW